MPAEELIAWMRSARDRTLQICAIVRGEELLGPMLPIVNPFLWEVGHVGWFYERFALRLLDGRPWILGNSEQLYNSSAIPHDVRWGLPLPDLDATLGYLERVQQAMEERLTSDLASEADTYHTLLTLFHEDMHGESFAWNRQTHGWAMPQPELEQVGGGPCPGDVEVPGCIHALGSVNDGTQFVFDNQKWAHDVVVKPFQIARAPVTNEAFAAFVDDGGYRERRWWSEAGWRWRAQAEANHPVYWTQDPSGWFVRLYDRVLPLPAHQPVVHVAWYEAEAYCRWAGRRLPTEAEWEVAASRVPTSNGELAPGKRRFPWGGTPPVAEQANLDARHLGCVEVGAFAGADSPLGCRQMIGNVWEWTQTPFAPFPGFSPDSYADYSVPWFEDGRKVLRGGCWTTRSRMIDNEYRNYFTPDRRDIFAGFRTCAVEEASV